MFDFRFNYSENDIYPVYDVDKVSFQSESEWKEISGEDIMSACIPLDTIIHLYSHNGKYIISCENVRSIEITKLE